MVKQKISLEQYATEKKNNPHLTDSEIARKYGVTHAVLTRLKKQYVIMVREEEEAIRNNDINHLAKQFIIEGLKSKVWEKDPKAYCEVIKIIIANSNNTNKGA